jgi:hypothetical protein
MMENNSEGGARANGSGTCILTVDKAWALYENQYLASSNMRLPSG